MELPVQPGPLQDAALAADATLNGPRATVSDSFVEEHDKPSALDTALSMFRRETIFGMALNDYNYRAFNGDPAEGDPAFNPYGHFAANEKSYADLEPYVRQGLFDRTYSASQFDVLAAQLRHEQQDIRNIEQGSGAGLALGMGLSMLDTASLIPFAGPVKGAGLLRNAGRVAASAAAIQGGQELALRQQQGLRTTQESFLNIGITGALGGGIGIFGHAMLPSARTKIAKALDAETVHPTGVMVPGGEVEVVGSVGAARATGDTEFAGSGLVSAITKPLRAVTPVGRATLWASAKARETTQKLVDLGGTVTKHMENGESIGPSVEDVALDHMSRTLHEGTTLERRLWQDMMAKLGITSSRLAAGAKTTVNTLTGGLVSLNKLEQHEFQEIVRRKLSSDRWKGLQPDRGPVGSFDAVDQKAIDDLLLKAGITDDEARKTVDTFTTKAANEWLRISEETEERMVRLGMITEDQRLGKAYGYAQLWNRQGVTNDKAAFKDWLLDVFSKRPDREWLKDNHGLALEDFEKLPMGDAKRADIINEWTQDAEMVRLEQSKAKLDAARRAYEEATQVSEWSDLGLTQGRRENAQAKAGEIRASIRAKEAENALARVEVFGRAVRLHEERVAKLREAILAGQKADTVGTDFLKHFEDVKRIEGLVDEAAAKGNVPAAENLTVLYERAVADLERTRGQLKAHLDALKLRDPRKVEAALERAKTGETVSLAKLDERLRAIEAQDARVKVLNERLAETQRLRRAAFEQYKTLRSGAKQAGLEARKAAKDLKAAAKAAKRAEKKAPLIQTVEDIVNAMGDGKRMPMGILENAVGESGRVKDRRIILTAEERRFAEERGWLHKDLSYILDRQYTDLSGRMALREVFGEEESLEKTLKAVDDDYEMLERAASDPKKRQKIANERESAKRDVIDLRDRILGRARIPDDPESWVTWGMNKLRQLNFVRFAAGFPIASLTDLATSVLQPIMGRGMVKAGGRFFQILKEAGVDPKSREALVFLNAAELHMAHSTNSKALFLNELRDELGIGGKGSLTKTITGNVDRVSNTLASNMNTWSGMAGYNMLLKGIAGLVQLDNIRQWVGKYEALSKLQKTQLASVGIGRSEAKKLNEMFEKYGEVHEKGFDANSHLWGSANADIARTLRVAIRRTMNRAVVTPGYGDVPLFMSREYGKLIMQFQSFGFATVNRILVPAIQRGSQGDARVAAWFAANLSLATGITAFRNYYMNGKNPAEFTPGQWTREVVDRSGLLAFMSPYADATLKLTGMEPGGVSTRYRNNRWWESLMGPWAHTLTTLGQSASAAVEGDVKKLGEKTFLLAPFNQWARIFNNVADQLQGQHK